MEFISQLCLEVPSKNRFFPPSLAGPWSLDHAEWMALELYTDRKINASYQEASGVRLGSHVHVNKAIGFFFSFLTAQSYHLPTSIPGASTTSANVHGIFKATLTGLTLPSQAQCCSKEHAKPYMNPGAWPGE